MNDIRILLFVVDHYVIKIETVGYDLFSHSVTKSKLYVCVRVYLWVMLHTHTHTHIYIYIYILEIKQN